MNIWGRLHQLEVKKAGCKPYTGLCNVQLYDKYLHKLHQLKLQSGTTTPGVDDAR